MPRRRGPSLAVACSVAFAFAGCGARPELAERLRVLAPTVPDRLDPARDSRTNSRTIFLNVFEPLVRVDSAGHLAPALAESWANPAPEIYSFQLRPGVLFHDGEALEAAHVVAALEDAREPSSLFAGNLADVVDVRAAGPLSVEVRTALPTAVLLPALTVVLVHKPAKEGRLPAGTGPFRLVEFRPGERVRLRRFDGYHDRKPILEDVTFQRFGEPDEAVVALGEPEPVAVLDPPKTVVLAALENESLRVVSELSGSLVYLAFSLREDAVPAGAQRNPFRDVRVRRAFRMALDLEALVREATPLGGVAATQVIPPGVFGFDPRRAVAARDVPGARRLLAEAGHPSGLDVVLDVRRNDSPLGEALARQLAEAGVRVRVEPLASDEFLRKRGAGESALYAYNWVVGEDSGQGLKSFFHTRDPVARLGLRNVNGYSNPAVDEAIEEALASLEPKRRLALLRKALALLAEDLPWVPLYADKTIRVYPRSLTFPRRLDGMLILSEATPATAGAGSGR